jgi:hypothetical protein
VNDSNVSLDDVNRSLDARSIVLLRALNPYLVDLREEGRAVLVGFLERLSDGAQATLPLGAVDDFMAQFAQANARIAEQFGFPVQRIGDPLFGAAARPHGRSLESVTVDELAERMARLWMMKEEQTAWMYEVDAALSEWRAEARARSPNFADAYVAT